MAHYVLGDLQGCDRTFSKLLNQIAFDPERDRLWLVGDLVNRGPASLEVLRRILALGPAVRTVLGNHDLYLLARFAGLPAKEGDTLEPVLAAPDAPSLCAWLRQQPLAVFEAGRLMVHAGVMPDWSLGWTLDRARAVEARLRGPDWADFVLNSRPNTSAEHEALSVLTRLRMVSLEGKSEWKSVWKAEWKFNGHPDAAPPRQMPWFEHSQLLHSGEAQVLFGHWAALGFRRLEGAIALDSGCVWGRHLTALRLDDDVVFEEPLVDEVEFACD